MTVATTALNTASAVSQKLYKVKLYSIKKLSEGSSFEDNPHHSLKGSLGLVVVVIHTFTPSTWEAEAGRSL